MKLSLVTRWYITVLVCMLMIAVQSVSVISQEVGGFSYPVWSPDGNYIAFASINNGEYEILLTTQDKTVRSLTGDANEGYIEDIRWSPDGNYIAYTAVAESNIDIWIVHVLNGQPYNLTSNMNGLSRSPAWSQDSASIGFTNREFVEDDNPVSLSSQVWVIDIDTMEAIQLTPDDSCSINPQWSMDNNAVMFVSWLCPGHEEGLYRYDFDDNEVVPIVSGSIQDYVVFPLEEHFAVAVWQSRSFILTDVVLLSDTSVDLATGLYLHGDLSLSPNGEQLAMTALCDYGSKIVSLNIVNHALSDITICIDDVFSFSPSWSPNSSVIVYQSNGDIWLYDLTTEEHINLTEDF